MHPQDGRAPHIEKLLGALRKALVRQIWLHGLGTTLAITALWLCFAFGADYFLHLPTAIRVLHGLILLGLPIYLLRRELLRHLRAIPDRAGLALLIEKHQSDSQDLLVSAVQLAPELAAAGSSTGSSTGKTGAAQLERAALLGRVLERAEALAQRVDLAPVLDRRGPSRRALLGLTFAAVVILGGLSMPGLSAIFLRRLAASSVSWPRRTTLTLEIPPVGELVQVERSEGEISLRVARGSDVPVLVRAQGEIPSEVSLHFDSGQEVVVGSGGGPLFRTRLPAVQEDTSFYVTGGDDQRGRPVVHIVVLRPPDVAAIAIEIEPPAYSGLPARIVGGGDVEVLQNSKLRIHMLPDPARASGLARLLPEDRTCGLLAAPFPASALPGASADSANPPAQSQQGLAFDILAEASLRYRFELTDESGLPNPDPGLYSVEVVEDARPELILVSPSRAEMDVVLGGALPLRVRLADDFGIEGLSWSTRLTSEDESELAAGRLELRAQSGDPEAAAGKRVQLVAHQRLEVAELFGSRAPGSAELSAGAGAVLQLEALDNREPTAGQTLSAPVHLRVVSPDEYLRRVQDELARSGEMASRLSKLEGEKLVRSRELAASLGGEEARSAALSSLATTLSGLRRVQGDARALSRELTSITLGLLYSRADEHAEALLERIDEELAKSVDRSFHPQPWRTLVAAYGRGELGRAGLAGQLVEIVGLALEISEDASTQAVASLELATARPTPGELNAALAASMSHQEQAIDKTTRLLERLAEWDNLNSILTLTRDILNRQKNLTERTRQFAKDN